MSKNRNVILEIIENVTCHPTAEDIYLMAKEKGQKMSLATIYNNLSALSEAGEIRKLSNPGQPDRYDKLLRHDHLICTKCGKITDVFLKDITKSLAKETGILISSYDLKLLYLCDECK